MTIKLNTRAIKKLMAERRMTIKTMAQLARINRNTLSVIFRRGTCSPISAGLIASALQVDVEEIWKEDS